MTFKKDRAVRTAKKIPGLWDSSHCVDNNQVKLVVEAVHVRNDLSQSILQQFLNTTVAAAHY